MEQRIYHGDMTPNNMAQALIAQFSHGNIRAQQLGSGDQVIVQVATRQGAMSGGATALSITLQKVEDGVAIQVGKQAWLGIAASLGTTALAAIRNPLNLLGRLDDLAQDIESLQLSQDVWQAVEEVARAAGASTEISKRLRRLVCTYCGTPNPVNEPYCIACGAPLGEAQPRTCSYCGFIIKANESICPNCKRPILTAV